MERRQALEKRQEVVERRPAAVVSAATLAEARPLVAVVASPAELAAGAAARPELAVRSAPEARPELAVRSAAEARPELAVRSAAEVRWAAVEQQETAET